ncbi:MAG: response regulator transcription factor [Actinobacteria bacterium]|nr:response regulator transcription factor [Actinomycetota bacterium]MCB9425191.1 response regulator transcription factor [Actinomycetota bacterium]
MSGDQMRVAIIDDHLMFAEGLRAWLTEHAPTVQVVYLGVDPAQVMDLEELDVVLLDIDLGPGGPRAADTVEAFSARGIPVLLVSAVVRGTPLREALLAGAGGYVSKASDPDALLNLLREVADGNYVLTREIAEVMYSPSLPDLSGQELRALQLYAQGLTLKAVARRMSVSQNTAKEYLDRVRAKYLATGRAARTKAELQAAAREDGLLHDEE